MKRTLLRVFRDEGGYVATLALIAMPLLLGFCLLVIDASRSANLQTDLQNAVDALALTGARELDGRDDAITRAKAKMAELANQARFGGGGAGMSLGSTGTNIIYDPNNDSASTVWVHFLKSTPTSDDMPINLATEETTDPNAAAYAYVIAKPQAMTTIFPLPVGLNRDTIDVGAQAVAVYQSAACDVVPMFICNPFEGIEDLSQAAEDGRFHGALISLHLPQNQGDPAGPGNFGFLSVPAGNGAAQLKAYFAGTNGSPLCYAQGRQVTTETGQISSIEAALNTRFDMSEPGLGSVTVGPPAVNVRKGIKTPASSTCDPKPKLSVAAPTANGGMAFPDDATTVPNTGGLVGNGDWDCNTYWNTNYGTSTGCPADIPSSFPGKPPSRYDVYRYEISTGMYKHAAPSGETGQALCYMKDNQQKEPPGAPDRRTIVAALVNCTAQGAINGKSELDVAAYAKVFLARPVYTNNNSDASTTQRDSINVEITDISGPGGSGTLDNFLREESELVR